MTLSRDPAAQPDVPQFDVVHACDPRYFGGTGSAVRAELQAGHAAGLRQALLTVIGNAARRRLFADRRLSALTAQLDIPHLAADTPADCDILFCHHPQAFAHMPDRPVALRPRRVVMVLHHPPLDGAGVPHYNPDRLIANLRQMFGRPAMLAPVGPAVRAQLDLLDVDPALILPQDHANLLMLDDWPLRDRPPPRRGQHIVIGRHARPDPLKWPPREDHLLAAWPDLPGAEVRILGGAHLPEGMARPAHWRILPFRETGLSRFLRGLDFYVFFHHPDWVEAFGLAVAEAMATGLVCILPPALEPAFGDAAVYCEPEGVAAMIGRFLDDPDAYRRQSQAARDRIAAAHASALLPGRLARLRAVLDLPPLPARALPPPADRPPAATAKQDSLLATPLHLVRPPARQRLLMVCGNGIGLGHVTRLMAVARRLPDWIEPVFLTRSLGTHLLRAQGFSADYIESATRAGVTDASWNEAFAVETEAMLQATGARMVLFDSNVVYPGLMQLMPHRPDVHWLWLRRALWQPHHRLNGRHAPAFHAVIEPAELAGNEDGGPTVNRPDVEGVGPILICPPDARLPRDVAARELGVDPDRRVVAVQLGSGRNFDMAPLREGILAALAGHDVQVMEIANPLAAPRDDGADPGAFAASPPRRAVYPLYPLTRAIDLMVVAPGYNSFHECVFGGVPSVFVPNQDGIMDDQHLRAAWAQGAGLGLCLTRADLPRAQRVVDQALSPGFAAGVAGRAAGLDCVDGAAMLARMMATTLVSARCDGRMAHRLPRP